GTSRVWKLAARPDERFANMELPGMSVDSVLTLFERLHALAPRRSLTVYLGVEPFWFSQTAPSSSFEQPSLESRLRLLAAAQTLDATLREVTRRPWDLASPPSRRTPQVVRTASGCLLDADNAVRRGAANAWAMDGTFRYAYELNGTAEPRKDFLTAYLPRMRAPGVSRMLVGQLRAALAYARTAHWRVVGFTPPFAHRSLLRIEGDAGAAPLLASYRVAMPRVFGDYGFRYVDTIDARSVPCGETEFTEDDGAHPDAACAARLRKRLDAAARS
ncbi:MAG TPA: hypothetical protein VMU73_09870, partial [Gaiellaceae bacterium]|nr:hypothetical protein [Gaiellaceae bacterium]